MGTGISDIKPEKPSLLFILTGLGRYSWYRLPFMKRSIICCSLPAWMFSRIAMAVNYIHGKCHCRVDGKQISCSYISVLGVSVGLCKNMKQLKTSEESTQYKTMKARMSK